MKMTIEIPEDVLAEVMALTGRQTKREAVEYALREAARRARQHRIWSAGLGLTPDQLAADAAPKPSDDMDAPDIDVAAVDRAITAHQRRLAWRASQPVSSFLLNDPPAPPQEPQT